MTLSPDNIAHYAKLLRDAETKSIAIAPLRDHIPDADAAYAIQEHNTRLRLEGGGRLVGRKIGLTNPVVQRQLGVNQPDYGMLFADMDLPHNFELAWNAGAQWKVEAELAFILDRPLTACDVTMAEVIRAVAYVVPAIEIVGSRIANWDIQFVDTVADNASSAYFTLGPSPKLLKDIDLLNCTMSMHQGAELVSKGMGRACLGNPLNAVLWVAQVMAKAGRPLREGDVVLSGALGPMVAATAGAQFTAYVEGFGETAIRFGQS